MSGRHGEKHKEHRDSHVEPQSGQHQSQGAKAPQPTQNQPEDIFEAAIEERGSLMKWFRKPDPFDVALYGLIVALAVAVIYFYQLRSMQKSVKLTRIAIEVEQRPWIKLDYGQGSDLQFQPSQPSMQKITVTNIGKTPLLNLRLHLGMEIALNGTIPKFDWNKYHWESKVPILLSNSPVSAPAELLDDSEEKVPHILTQSEYDDVMKTNLRVLITYARVVYTDTLGGGHWQQFCTWAGFAGVSNLNQTITHTKCVEYNGAGDTAR